jgi:ribosomal protein S18 acetylase RimI-like enzyme
MILALHPASPADLELLYGLHRATMRDYIHRTWGWDEAWQRSEFERRCKVVSQQLIILDGKPVGMLELENRPAELFIANIQVLPEKQGQGIGSAVIREIVRLADDGSLAATLQVLQVNKRARRLYERLGFKAFEEVPPHTRMRVQPRTVSGG